MYAEFRSLLDICIYAAMKGSGPCQLSSMKTAICEAAYKYVFHVLTKRYEGSLQGRQCTLHAILAVVAAEEASSLPRPLVGEVVGRV